MAKVKTKTIRLATVKGDDSMFVSVNGKNMQIRRGIPVEVPDYVAEVIQNSIESDEAAEIRRALLQRNAQ